MRTQAPFHPSRRSCQRLAIAVGAIALLASCAPAAPEAPPPVPTSEAAPPTSARPGAASPSPTFSVEPLAAVDCPGPESAPTALEASLLVEAGPFSGESFDANDVVRQIDAEHVPDVEGWGEQIRVLIQGDYAQVVCDIMTFSGAIGAGRDTPEDVDDPSAMGEEAVGRNHFALVLDASGSMAAASGGTTRMAAAKESLASFVAELPADATVSVRVYGHEGDNSDAGREQSCASSEVVFNGPADGTALAAGIAAVEPVGWTPLAQAITDAAADIPEGTTDAIVYVVTDGIETCDGDPVRAAEALAVTGVQPIVNVIGFETGDADTEALRAIALAGGGEFTRVGSGADLDRHWRAEHRRMLGAWTSWRNAEIGRIRAEARDHISRAGDLNTALRDMLRVDRANADELLAVMRAEEVLPDVDLDQLTWWFHDWHQEIDNYAFDTNRAHQSAIMHAESEAFTEAYDTASGKWTDHYDTSRRDG